MTAEAINLDTPDPVTGGFGSVWSNLDGTANVRVTVANNRFDGMVRALGTHNFTPGSFPHRHHRHRQRGDELGR